MGNSKRDSQINFRRERREMSKDSSECPESISWLVEREGFDLISSETLDGSFPK